MTYTCAACGATFESHWTEEEALAEMEAKFGQLPEDQQVCICDPCYRQALANERATIVGDVEVK